jgi:muramoyltetrapeptide carboxypeptidase
MNPIIIPKKLTRGDVVRIIAPGLSMSIIGEETRRYAKALFEDSLGLKVTFGDHVEESDELSSSSIESRAADLHSAFADSNVKAVLTIIGGFNGNQLLNRLDWDLIKSNPKIFCGYSDTTALLDAIYGKTGLVTYYGPSYSTFGQKKLDNYTLDYYQRCLFSDQPYRIAPSKEWTDDQWYLDQDNRQPLPNDGWWTLSEGSCSGQIIGGNLCTLNLLQGTPYMPSGKDIILFVEDDEATNINLFSRDLTSLLQSSYFKTIKGLVIGRFQRASKIERPQIEKLIHATDQLNGAPVLANVDFGHTNPMTTFPIGGQCSLSVSSNGESIIEITKH